MPSWSVRTFLAVALVVVFGLAESGFLLATLLSWRVVPGGTVVTLGLSEWVGLLIGSTVGFVGAALFTVLTIGRPITARPDVGGPETLIPPLPRDGLTYWLGRPATDEKGLVGRDAELATLGTEMAAKRATVVSGIPGVGKSRLAAEWTARSHRDGFWTQGKESVPLTIAELAPSLGINSRPADEGALVSAVLRRIASLLENRLWVIDNLPDIDAVNGLLADAGRLHLLVTTRDDRRHLLSESPGFLRVEVLGHNDAIALLRSRDPDLEQGDPDLAAIAQRVGNLPMALEVLAGPAPCRAPRRSPSLARVRAVGARSGAFGGGHGRLRRNGWRADDPASRRRGCSRPSRPASMSSIPPCAMPSPG